jgi:hypothetical protein
MLSAGAGVASANSEEPVATSTLRRAPTAWAFIQSRPELAEAALWLDWAGYKDALTRPFSGTLLLLTTAVSVSLQHIRQPQHIRASGVLLACRGG